MDKKIFEEFLKKHCVTEEPVWHETVYESELDPATGLEHIVKREVTVQGGLEVKKLRPHLHHCDYCDKTVTDQKVVCRIAQDPVPHWRSRCQTCKCYLHPETQKPIEEPHISSVLNKLGVYWRNKKLGLKQFKKPQEPQYNYRTTTMETSGGAVTAEIEDSDEATITRFYYDDDK